MKINYEVSYSGSVDIDNEVWEGLKQDYQGDVNRFAMVSVMEEIGMYDENAITVTNVEGD